jgi:hypothetical protein
VGVHLDPNSHDFWHPGLHSLKNVTRVLWTSAFDRARLAWGDCKLGSLNSMERGRCDDPSRIGILSDQQEPKGQLFPKWNWIVAKKWPGLPDLRVVAKRVTSHSPLATNHCLSNRYTAQVDCPVTHSKQTSLVLSNRYKFVPSGGVASWLTHRPHRHFYPVQPANRNRRNPLKTNDGRIFYSIQKATPRGSD